MRLSVRLYFFLLLIQASSIGLSQNKSVQSTNINGYWRCIYSVYDDGGMLAKDESSPYWYDSPDLFLFRNDTVYEFEYPCRSKGRHAFLIQGDSLFYKTQQRSGSLDSLFFTGEKIQIRNDTLFLHKGELRTYTSRKFVRDSVDESIIQLLLAESINPTCLLGKWYLQTKFNTGYDGNGIVPIDFPFVVEHSFTIDVSNYNSRVPETGYIQIRINGKMRRFYILKIVGDGYRLELNTEEWHKADYPYTIHFCREAGIPVNY
jgi:hypothetical protein